MRVYVRRTNRWLSSDQPGKGAPGWVLWSDRALRRDSGSGVSPTGPVSRRAAKPPSHQADEPPSARAPEKRAHLVHANTKDRSKRAPRMRCPDTAVFRLLSPPLVARPLTRLAIRSGQSHPGIQTQPPPARQRLERYCLRAIRWPNRCGRVRAVRNYPSNVHAAACHRVVWTHLFSSHPAVDASDHLGPVSASQPQGSIKASHEARNEPEKCLSNTMAGRSRALFVTKRHKTSRFGHFFYLSVQRKTAELENNTMIEASCAVSPFSDVLTS